MDYRLDRSTERWIGLTLESIMDRRHGFILDRFRFPDRRFEPSGSLISLQVYALEYGSLCSTGATTNVCSGLCVLGSPGTGTAQSRIHISEAIQKFCMTRCETK